MGNERALGGLLEPLYASVLDLSALDTFNQRLAEATDSHISGVLIHDVTGGRAQVSRIHGVDSARMGVLLAELDLRDDPWMQRVTPRLATGRVLGTEQVLARTEAVRSGFYDAYYRQLGIVEQAASVGLHDGTNSVTLSICHGQPQRFYGETELGLLRELTPHWINAYAMLRRMQHLEQRAATFEQALEQAPVAMFVLAHDLRLLRCNAAGDALLGRGVVRRAGGRLATRAGAPQGLHALLQRALRGGSRLQGGDVERLVLDDGDAQPALALTAHRLTEWSGLPQQAALLVFVREIRQAPQALGSVLQALFDLTEAEARLALALYRHADIPLAAEACGITPGTAQGRLKVVYGKTRERGQVALVRLISTIAAVA